MGERRPSTCLLFQTTPVMRLFIVLLFSGLLTQMALAQHPEEAAVLAVTQQIFDGINQKNGDLIRSAMIPEGMVMATFQQEGTHRARFTSAEDFISQVDNPPQEFHERMFETTVHIQKGIAVVWAAYDFHLDGAFSHCGIDNFSLVKIGEEWKVVSLTYTVEMEGCAKRPPIERGSDG